MLDQNKVCQTLANNGISFFTGVPDSYLNGFCNQISKCGDRNVIAANEGNAIGIAAGHYFATKEIPLVYMQNSGLGNAINPLASLVDENVYSIPMLLLIGWRGEGNSEPNHPQHQLQGEITTSLLEILNIPYSILQDDDKAFAEIIEKATKYCIENRKPYGLISPKGVMASAEKSNSIDGKYTMSREIAMETIINNLPHNAYYLATTGRATRELFFLRERRGEKKNHDFLNLGSMGHASSVALGMALGKPKEKIVILDGDSACIMHMGAMAILPNQNVSNLLHIVLNNGVHDSVGGQPSVGYHIDLTKIAEACGYQTIGKPVTTIEELEEALKELKDAKMATFIDCRIHKGLSRKLPPIIFDTREAIDSLILELNKDF